MFYHRLCQCMTHFMNVVRCVFEQKERETRGGRCSCSTGIS